MMTLQDVVDAIKAQMTVLKSWFDVGANHLGNLEILQLTLGQAAFTLLFMLIGLFLAAAFLDEFR